VSASWDRRALGDVLVAKYGKALPQKDRRGGQFGVYGSNGPVGAHDEAITSAPVIVIGRKGSVGAINYSDEPVWPIDTTYFVDEFDGLDAQFVRRLLESLRLEQLDRSTAIPGLSRSQLYEQEVAVPPLPEQRQIAAWLDQIDARCALIADRLAAGHAIVGQLRGAVLGAACSGRLTTDWRSAHQVQTVPPGRALSSQAQRHGSGAENSDNFTQIPESWGWWSVESVISTVIDYRGRTPPSSEAGTIPHVRTTQFRDGRIDWNVDRFVTVDTYDTYMTRGLPQRGDVLFTMEAPLGEVGVVDVDHPFSIAQRILLLRPGDGITGDYLALALRSPAVRRAIELRSTGSGVSGVAYKRLRSVLIPKPPLEEQFEIVRKAHAALRTAGEVAAALSSAGDALDRAVRAAAAAAFRGELVAADDLELVV
jgi:type I restriction enzyme S subunit